MLPHSSCYDGAPAYYVGHPLIRSFLRGNRAAQLRALPPWFWAATVASAMIVGFATAAALHEAERRTLAEAAQMRGNLARSLAEHQESSLRAIDISLQTLRESWQRDREGFAAAVERHEVLLRNERVIQIAVVDRNGWPVFSRAPVPRVMNFADRAYFRAHQASGRDELLVSEPMLGRITGEWAIQVSRPMLDQQRFAGLIVVAIPVPALELVYDDIELGEGAIIGLVRADGRVLARSSGLPKGRELSVAGIPGTGAEAPRGGEFFDPGRLDGVERFVSYHRLRSYPLTVYVGQARSTLLARYQRARPLAIAGTVAATFLFFAIAALILLRRAERERAAATEARLQAEVGATERRFFEERERMMLEVHDGSIQSVYGTGLQLEEARALIEREPARAARAIAEAQARLNLVIHDLRQFLSGDKPRKYASDEFVAEVGNLVNAHGGKLAGSHVELEAQAIERLSAGQAAHVLRIVGESLSNIARHASAQRADVSLRLHERRIHLEIADDGAGISHGTSSGRGLGLHHVQVRAQKLGGRAIIESNPGAGTRVSVDFPAAT